MTALLLGLWLLAAPPTPEVARLLDTVEAAITAHDAPAALAAVQGWPGPSHPLVDLARGHALSLAERHPEAIDAYRAALTADPTLREAGLGLIGALARTERWPALCAELPRWMHLTDADAPTVRLWLAAALGAEDLLLAEEIARRGLVRFPDDDRLRQGLAHVYAASGRPGPAAAILRHLLDANPADAALWQRLAAVDPAATRPALEAALLADPDDLPARARLVATLLAAELNPAALRYAGPLAQGEPDQRLLAIRAAVAADDLDRADAWLQAVGEQTPATRRLAARVALARGDRRTARRALAALLADGGADVMIQLAALEHSAGALDRAEALLRQALATPEPGPAALHLAHLLMQRGRRPEAAAILRRHLARQPADEAARSLLTAIE